MNEIYLNNNNTIKTLSRNEPIRGKRALMTKIFNSDGTVDCCFNKEMLNDIIKPFVTEEEVNGGKEVIK